MRDTRLCSDRAASAAADIGLLDAVERASATIARLDQALENHPLLPAFLHRARLEAVRRQAAVDGQSIDPVVDLLRSRGLSLRHLVEKRFTLEVIFMETVVAAEPGVDVPARSAKRRT